MKKTQLIISLIMIGFVSVLSLMTTPVYAVVDPVGSACGATGGSSVICTGGSADGGKTEVQNIVNLLLYVLGVIAVIVIVIAGIRYATSGGDANAVKGAKDTILYAVVGLIVAILAYAIVNFVLGKF